MKYFWKKTENINLRSKKVMKSVLLIQLIIFVFNGCNKHNNSPAVTQKHKFTEISTSSTLSQTILLLNKKKFEGTWNRTNVESSIRSTIEIKNVTNDGFDFSVVAFYWSHIGDFDGKAKFKSDREAVCEVNDYEIGDVVNFIITFKNNELSIPEFDENSLPVGMSVTIDGVYTKGEPQYTNAQNYSLIIPNNEIENIIKSKLSADEYSYFEIAAHDGYVTQDNIDGDILYNIETATIGGYSAHIIVTEDNIVYLWCGFSELQFYTNDKNYSQNEIYRKAEKLIN